MQPPRSFASLPGPSQLFDSNSEKRFPSYERRVSYPAVGSLSISAPSTSCAREISPDVESRHRSGSRSAEVGSNDGEGSQKGKKRRAESVETDDNTKKSRNPRKTAVACNFCRGEFSLFGWTECQIILYLCLQDVNCDVMVKSRLVIIVPFANLSANTFPSNVGEVQGKLPKEAVRRKAPHDQNLQAWDRNPPGTARQVLLQSTN